MIAHDDEIFIVEFQLAASLFEELSILPSSQEKTRFPVRICCPKGGDGKRNKMMPGPCWYLHVT